MSLVKSYEGGRESHARVVVKSLFEEYLSVEELFNDNLQVSLKYGLLNSHLLTKYANNHRLFCFLIFSLMLLSVYVFNMQKTLRRLCTLCSRTR